LDPKFLIGEAACRGALFYSPLSAASQRARHPAGTSEGRDKEAQEEVLVHVGHQRDSPVLRDLDAEKSSDEPNPDALDRLEIGLLDARVSHL